MRIIGLLLFFGIILLAVGPDRVLDFIDPPSIVVVLGAVICGLIYSYGFKNISYSFSKIFAPKDDLRDDERNFLIQYFTSASNYSLAGGIIWTLIVLVLMLGNMSDIESLGPNIAVALLTILYGLFFSEFVFPGIRDQFIKNGKKEVDNSQLPKKRINILLFVICYIFLLHAITFVGMTTF